LFSSNTTEDEKEQVFNFLGIPNEAWGGGDTYVCQQLWVDRQMVLLIILETKYGIL
jgi:hypothetical protein